MSEKYDECQDYYAYYVSKKSTIPSQVMHLADWYLENQMRFVDAYITDRSSECLFFRMHRDGRHVFFKIENFEQYRKKLLYDDPIRLNGHHEQLGDGYINLSSEAAHTSSFFERALECFRTSYYKGNRPIISKLINLKEKYLSNRDTSSYYTLNAYNKAECVEMLQVELDGGPSYYGTLATRYQYGIGIHGKDPEKAERYYELSKKAP